MILLLGLHQRGILPLALLTLVGAGHFIGCANQQSLSASEALEEARTALEAERPEEAVEWLQIAAEHEQPEALVALAEIREFGLVRNAEGAVIGYAEQDRKESQRLYQLAAGHLETVVNDEEDPIASALLASMFWQGRGVDQDRQRALSLWRDAAAQGHTDAQYAVGFYGYWHEGEYLEALEWIRPAADEGHAGAQYLMHIAYRQGQGTESDFETAVDWLRLAAQGGNLFAQRDLRGLEEQGLL